MPNWHLPQQRGFPGSIRFNGKPDTGGLWTIHTRIQDDDGGWMDAPVEEIDPPFQAVALFGLLKTGHTDFSKKPARGFETLRYFSQPQVEPDPADTGMKPAFSLPLYMRDRKEILVLTNNSEFAGGEFLRFHRDIYCVAPQARTGLTPVIEIQPAEMRPARGAMYPCPIVVGIAWVKWNDALFGRRVNPPPTSDGLLIEGAPVIQRATATPARLPSGQPRQRAVPPPAGRKPPPPLSQILDDEIPW
jgi:hypothetical protein